MKKILLIVIPVLIVLSSCKHEELGNGTGLDLQLFETLRNISPTGSPNYYILPESTDFANIPQDPKNPLSWEKVELGKMLFFETGLALDAKHSSSMGTYSCATCHNPNAGFLPKRAQGIADGGIGIGHDGDGRTMAAGYAENELDVQGMRPLSVLNVAYAPNTLWNGMFGSNGNNEGTENIWDTNPFHELTQTNKLGYHGLESQNIEGFTLHRMIINKDVTDSLGYTPYFDRAFPGFPSDNRYSLETGALAVSAYLRTLLTTEAPFQKWLKGDKNAMTDAEKNGAMVFFGQAKCFYCHKSPALQAPEFQAVGVKGIYQLDDVPALATSKNDPRNLGRGGFTGKDEDLYKFQVPQLYNLRDAGFYFHGSSKRTLEEVIEYFNNGLPENPDVPLNKIAPQFTPLHLSDKQKSDLLEFLENGLNDNSVDRYVPAVILSGNCYPNNDPMSRAQLGCD